MKKAKNLPATTTIFSLIKVFREKKIKHLRHFRRLTAAIKQYYAFFDRRPQRRHVDRQIMVNKPTKKELSDLKG